MRRDGVGVQVRPLPFLTKNSESLEVRHDAEGLPFRRVRFEVIDATRRVNPPRRIFSFHSTRRGGFTLFVISVSLFDATRRAKALLVMSFSSIQRGWLCSAR
jgi:hypothetical protein